MKKIAIFIGFMVLFNMNAMIAHAGGLNENETAVVNAARGQFEKDGVRYQAAPAYINQLVNYLSQDDVDLTAAQKDEAIASIYANVDRGLKEGYLVPIESQTEDTGQESSNQENAPVTGTDTAEENSDTGQSAADRTDKTNNSETEDKKAENFINDIMNKPVVTTEIDRVNSKITVKDEEKKEILAVNMVIKNTGFNLEQTVAMMSVVVFIFILCIVVTIKYRFFAHNSE